MATFEREHRERSLVLAPEGASVEGGGFGRVGFAEASPLVVYGAGARPPTLGTDSQEQAAELLTRYAVGENGVAAYAWRASSCRLQKRRPVPTAPR